MDKYLATYKIFWWECIKHSLKSSFNIFTGIATLLGVVALLVAQVDSGWRHVLNTLAWAIPVAVFIGSFLLHMIRFPHTLYKYQADKVREYEAEAIELQPDSIFESRRGIWVCRVGVRVTGQKSVRGVMVYLKYIDGNENALFDAPLRPAERLRNVTGAVTVNPGDTQRFVEVLHWNPSVPEMGIPYNLNYQLTASGINIYESPDSLPTKIDVGAHTLKLYATGEDIKPVERDFRVEIRDNQLKMEGLPPLKKKTPFPH